MNEDKLILRTHNIINVEEKYPQVKNSKFHLINFMYLHIYNQSKPSKNISPQVTCKMQSQRNRAEAASLLEKKTEKRAQEKLKSSNLKTNGNKIAAKKVRNSKFHLEKYK